MELDGGELDRIVYEIVRQRPSKISREELVEDVIDYVAPRILPSLERLMANGLIDRSLLLPN